MSRFHRGQLCFSISCCHRGPNTFFWTSGSLTPIARLPVAGAEDSNGVSQRSGLAKIVLPISRICNQATDGVSCAWRRAPQRSMKMEFGGSMLCRSVWSRGLRPYWCLRARGLRRPRPRIQLSEFMGIFAPVVRRTRQVPNVFRFLQSDSTFLRALAINVNNPRVSTHAC